MGRTICYSVERWPNISVWYVELAPGYELSFSDVIPVCSPNSNSVLHVLHVVQETYSIPFNGRRLFWRLWTTERPPHTRNTPEDSIVRTICSGVSMLWPEFRKIFMWLLIVAALRSQDAFPACGSEKSTRDSCNLFLMATCWIANKVDAEW